MRVGLSKYANAGDSCFNVDDRVTCMLGDAEVQVRHDGDHLVVVIQNGRDNKVRMESRAAAIWIEVHPSDD